MESKIVVPNTAKTLFGNFEYRNIWQPEPFAKKIKSDIPSPLFNFIERVEPLVDNYWLGCIAALLSRDSMKCNSEIEKCRLMYRAAILEQIIKLRWNSTFSANLRLPKRELGVFKLEGELWNCAINLMMELSLISPLKYPHTPIWFTLCIMEGQLGAFIPDVNRKIDFRKILQNGNQALKNYTNPFNQDESPSTWQLIEDSRKLAEHNDQFRKQKYTPMRKAREKLATHLINTPAQILSDLPKIPAKKRRPLKRPHSKGFQPQDPATIFTQISSNL
jgi:hypothetical protein